MKEKPKGLSSKSRLLTLLREKQGESVSGGVLAKNIGISRVAVWKNIQSLIEAGYSIETGETGYRLDPAKEKDFLYPWEFGEKEKLFYYYKNTGSTMDRARESALCGAESGSVFTAEKQSAGRGRNGRTWVSRQGGLFFSVLERPRLAIADYTQLSLIFQIAVVRSISSICGKKAFLRWPNDVYIDHRKIAGITTEISGEGDLLTWLTGGIGVNVNNPVLSGRTASCAEITQRNISRREVLIKILNEIEKVKKKFISTAAYSQGNRSLAAEWNSLADCIGAKAAVFEPAVSFVSINGTLRLEPVNKDENSIIKNEKILARGVFQGIDPAGRCIIKKEDETLYFNHGSVSLAFLNADKR
jgi:BirA family biotin operon repressor/biotin-[acetyl-CoA-carboxylase] ligase